MSLCIPMLLPYPHEIVDNAVGHLNVQGERTGSHHSPGSKRKNSARSVNLGQTLQTIRNLFDRVVGIAHYENAVREQARRIFAERGPDFACIEGPAYLRRPARIGKSRGQ